MILSTCKRGTLDVDFKAFYMNDCSNSIYKCHYHDFRKIVFFLNGNVCYEIDDNKYILNPWDVVFINELEYHNVSISKDSNYERIVIWISNEFFEKYKNNSSELNNCFYKNKVISLSSNQIMQIKPILYKLKESIVNDVLPYNDILKESLVLQLLVYLNRYTIDTPECDFDKNNYFIDNVIQYILDNLNNNLYIDSIASNFFMSKYHLMRKFKAHTGMPIHKFINNHRLINFKKLVLLGNSFGEAAEKSGFNDYSTLVRAFKRAYSVSPSQYFSDIQFDSFDSNFY